MVAGISNLSERDAALAVLEAAAWGDDLQAFAAAIHHGQEQGLPASHIGAASARLQARVREEDSCYVCRGARDREVCFCKRCFQVIEADAAEAEGG